MDANQLGDITKTRGFFRHRGTKPQRFSGAVRLSGVLDGSVAQSASASSASFASSRDEVAPYNSGRRMTHVKELFDLTGKVAIVTGGSRGLGLAIATGLGEAGAAVAITARREQWLTPARAAL